MGNKGWIVIILLVAGFGLPAWGFPTWSGIYGPFQYHDGGNPGTFTILANQDYPGLEAEVSYAAGTNQQEVFAMEYQGTVDGNAMWSYSPPVPFSIGESVSFRFRIFESGTTLERSDPADPAMLHQFIAQEGPSLYWVGNVHHYPDNGNITSDTELWINAESWPLNAGLSAEVVFTRNNGATWEVLPMNRAALSHNDHWYVSLGRLPEGTTVRYAIRVYAWNMVFWEGNRGNDYVAQVNAGANPLYWVGDTKHNVLAPSPTGVHTMKVDTQSWPANAGLQAQLVYSLQGNSWKVVDLTEGPHIGNNDNWLNEIDLPPGMIVFYHVEVEDGTGEVFIDPPDWKYVNISSNGHADYDGDWLPDAWEHYYYGSTEASPFDNPDGDGITTLPADHYMEFLLGANPRVSNNHDAVRMAWSPSIPFAEHLVTISYLPPEQNPPGMTAVIGHNMWERVNEQPLTYNPDNGRYETSYLIPFNTEELNLAIRFSDNTWDNNYGLDWLIPVALPGTDLDQDTLDDAWEMANFNRLDNRPDRDLDGDGLNLYEEIWSNTDPLNPDMDGDGLTDRQELHVGTDPRVTDSNGNSILDGDEDFDGDGYTNLEEFHNGSNPDSPISTPFTKIDTQRFRYHAPLRTETTCTEIREFRSSAHDERFRSFELNADGEIEACSMEYKKDWHREHVFQVTDVFEPTRIFFPVRGREAHRISSTAAQAAYDGGNQRIFTALVKDPGQEFIFKQPMIIMGNHSGGGYVARWPRAANKEPYTIDILVPNLPLSQYKNPGLVMGLHNEEEDLLPIQITHPHKNPITIEYDPKVIQLFEHPSEKLLNSDTGLWEIDAEISSYSGTRTYQGYDNHKLYLKGVSNGWTEIVVYDELTGWEAARLRVNVISPRLTPDWNRDGQINQHDIALTRSNAPYRFWINDDNDKAVYEGDDTPQSGSPDAADETVDSIRDLVDFFPVFVDLQDTLTMLGTSKFSYSLKNNLGNVGIIFAELEPDNAGDYLTHTQSAYNIVEKPVTQHTTASPSLELDTAFLSKSLTANKSVILIEGSGLCHGAIELQIRDRATKQLVYSTELTIALSNVEQMYRHINLRPDEDGRPTQTYEPFNYPDDLLNDKNVIFLHGFNVGDKDARGWHAEFFKRLYWAGSQAKFWGVTWEGDLGLVNALHYQDNVVNCFIVASNLYHQIHTLSNVTIMAHSLGNMVASSAIEDYGLSVDNYFMLNAAVAIEAYDNTTFDTAVTSNYMVHKDWQEYSTNTWSAVWHQHFSLPDDRASLTWRSRFSSALNVAYNFYSSGDEIFELVNGTPGLFSGGLFHLERYAWHKQEMFKGRFGLGSTDEAGWGFSGEYNTEEANLATPSALQANPVFRQEPAAMLSSNIAKQTQNAILGLGIPSLSGAVGRNEFVLPGWTKNFDMNDIKHPSYPSRGTPYNSRWLHSDLIDMSYLYTYLLFEEIINKGSLQ